MSTLVEHVAHLNARSDVTFAHVGGTPASIRQPREDLLAALEGLLLEPSEEAIIRWLLEWEGDVTTALASIIRKAKELR